MEGIDPTTRARATDPRDPEPITPKAGPKYDELPPDLAARVRDQLHGNDLARRYGDDHGPTAGKLDGPRYLGPAIERPTLILDGLRPTDIVQANLGDCTVEASLASLARTERGQAWLKSRMTETRGADGAVVSYTVQLKVPTQPGVYVDKPVLVYPSELAKGHPLQHDAAGNTETWPLVWEAAIAKAQGGFSVLNAGSNVPCSSAFITGKPAVDSVPRAEPSFETKLAADFAAGKLQVLSTGNPVDALNLPGSHAFTVVDVRELQLVSHPDGSTTCETLVYLRNPWGFADPKPLTIAQVQDAFAAYSAGDVP